ncbi:hypothetical protein [Arsenophonus endosymbiont of Bemisia tabaci]|nr:hypothetical protein [Arsenophonus endosymbiont of Bemisia tabaci]
MAHINNVIKIKSLSYTSQQHQPLASQTRNVTSDPFYDTEIPF